MSSISTNDGGLKLLFVLFIVTKYILYSTMKDCQTDYIHTGGAYLSLIVDPKKTLY